MTLKEAIKERGLSIGFLEREAGLPRNTLYNEVNGSKALPEVHKPAVKKILKKYKINFVV